MSRIGNRIIEVPSGVEIEVGAGNQIKVKGPKGELVRHLNQDMEIKFEDGSLTVARPTEQKRHRALHGLTNALLQNMVHGVSEGYVKELELVGVGYRCSNTGNLLELSLGYSHPIFFYIPDEIKLETISEKGQSPTVRLEGIDKQLIGQIASKIRSFRKTEPYKGKGIRFKGEVIRRKAGKTAAT